MGAERGPHFTAAELVTEVDDEGHVVHRWEPVGLAPPWPWLLGEAADDDAVAECAGRLAECAEAELRRVRGIRDDLRAFERWSRGHVTGLSREAVAQALSFAERAMRSLTHVESACRSVGRLR